MGILFSRACSGNSLHHARQVTLGLDVLADTKVSRSLLEERVLLEVSKIKPAYSRGHSELTFAAFFVEPAFPWGKGAGAGFFPLGGYH